jgi:pseudaminic acid synthase
MISEIGNFKFDSGNKTFIIAELSANHGRKYETAAASLQSIKETGADAVKLQTYTADTLTIDSDNEFFRIKQNTLWDGRTLYQLYREAYTPWEWQPKLKKIADDLDLTLFSSPFDKTAVDFLEKMNVPAYKVASFEITDIQLIEYIASKGKPVIISTGIAELADIEEALAACRRQGNDQIALLKCTSAYPAPMEEVNLRTIPDMINRFGLPVGISDHTLGISVPMAAVALGARIIEKHFILDRNLGGPDAAFSIEPEEFRTMVRAVRDVEAALGKVSYELSDRVRKNRIFARSLFIVADIQQGEIFTEQNIRSIRPGYGLAPKHLPQIIGKRAVRDLKKGTPLDWDMID